MIISDSKTLKQYQELGSLSTLILKQLYQAVQIGTTPLEVDQLANQLCKKNQVEPCFKGVGSPDNPYQYATCISVNEVVVHGIPNETPFQEGDVVKVDFGIKKNKLLTDHCFTLGLSPLSNKDQHLIEVSKKAIQNAVKLAIEGNKTGDLGFAIESTVLRANFNVAKEFVGHGIGHTMHEDPQLPSYGTKKSGLLLEKGMVLCIEAQVLAGEDDLQIADDGWSIVTKDESKAAMFEYMIVVGKNKPIVLTPTLNWPIIR